MRWHFALVGMAAATIESASADAKPTTTALEASAPDQSWDPPGYRDMRIAAAGMLADFPPYRWDIEDGPNAYYDIIDCSLGYDLPETDWRTGQYQELALHMSRLRIDFKRIGYRKEVYEQPLLDYEHRVLDYLPTAVPPPPYIPDDGQNAGDATPDDIVAAAPDTADADTEEDAADDILNPFVAMPSLAQKMEANRVQLQPRKPQIVADGGCGGAEDEFTVALAPATGRLWLINAFAFKVCERKVADPWDHRACGWTEYGAGDSAVASGRYMYEARWPGGVVRRGAKIFTPDPDSEDQSVVFRRN